MDSLRRKIKELPDVCGVYIMKSNKGKIIYIGKAISLKKRVSSYFNKRTHSPKTQALVSRVADIEFMLCDNEAQALILEASLIKENKPKYNIALKDGKSYPYIEVTKEEFPRIFTSRKKKQNGSIFFGPYTSLKVVKEVLTMIRRIFPYCSCKRRSKKPCFYYHLNLCPAPENTNITKAEYGKNINSICKILSGKKRSLIKELENKMSSLSKKGNFEKAAILRDRLFAIYNLYSGRKQLNQILFLKQILKLKKLPLVIEAIDVSNLKGKQATASVVVFRDGYPDKNSYRRYRIKDISSCDDYKMISEVVRRRYLRLKKEKKHFPDLLVIDGGLGHAGVAYSELNNINCNIAVCAIAKKNEEIWLPKKHAPIVIPKDNPSLKLIQRLRDEAHRFSRNYHLLLRKKSLFNK